MSYQCIVEACKACWNSSFISGIKNQDNCSGLVKAVAQTLNIPMGNGRADAIVDWLGSHPSWQKLDSGKEAKLKAETGHLVIAGLKSSEHSDGRSSGHVAIVIGGDLREDKYPKCWSGSEDIRAKSEGDKTTGDVWGRSTRDKVHYYYYAQFVVCKFN